MKKLITSYSHEFGKKRNTAAVELEFDEKGVSQELEDDVADNLANISTSLSVFEEKSAEDPTQEELDQAAKEKAASDAKAQEKADQAQKDADAAAEKQRVADEEAEAERVAAEEAAKSEAKRLAEEAKSKGEGVGESDSSKTPEDQGSEDTTGKVESDSGDEIDLNTMSAKDLKSLLKEAEVDPVKWEKIAGPKTKERLIAVIEKELNA